MSPPLIIRPEAQADIETIYDALEEVQTGLGRRFLGRVREVLERVESMPEPFA